MNAVYFSELLLPSFSILGEDASGEVYELLRSSMQHDWWDFFLFSFPIVDVKIIPPSLDIWFFLYQCYRQKIHLVPPIYSNILPATFLCITMQVWFLIIELGAVFRFFSFKDIQFTVDKKGVLSPNRSISCVSWKIFEPQIKINR